MTDHGKPRQGSQESNMTNQLLLSGKNGGEAKFSSDICFITIEIELICES